MNEKIKNILNDLYRIDPDLQKHEEALVSLITELIAAKPDTKFDAEFARNLKVKLLSTPMTEVKKPLPFTFVVVRNFLLTAGSVVAVIALAVSLQIYKPAEKANVDLSFSGFRVTKLASGAFGSFNSKAKTGEAVQNSSPAFGRGGGGGGAAVMSAPTADSKMMIYRPYTFKYVYKGDAIDLKDQNVDVLRKTKLQLNTSAAANALNKLSFGVIDLSTFGDSDVTSYELSQGDNGYIVNASLRDGSISISQNYSNPCPKGICPVLQPLQMSDIPADGKLIDMANSFLKDHKVDLSNYDAPFVQNDWRGSNPEGTVYVPDMLSVVYPQKLNGSVVYDMSGNDRGITVNVDIRNNKISGVWGISSQNYESSSYAAETDSKKILAVAERGGLYGSTWVDPNAEVVEIDLGTPKKVYLAVWMNDGSGEVTVPALYFPVSNASDKKGIYYQKAIVVPLAKDLLQSYEPGPEVMNGVTAPSASVKASN